jgi:hypothetical protein
VRSGVTDAGIATVTLSDRLADSEKPELTGRVDLGVQGGTFTELRMDAPLTDLDAGLRRLNVDPAFWQIDGESLRVSSWQQSKRTEDGDRDTITLYSYSGRIIPRREAIDLPALMQAAAKKPRPTLKPASSGTVTVVVLSDVQAGKVGGRGGTPELIGRLAEKREKLAAHLSQRKPERTVLIEGGDLFENFESGGNPMFTNDLSLAQQMDLAGTIVYQFIELMHRHGRVDVVAVPSNHTAWRRGSVNLGRPGDDLGLFVHKQVEKVAEAAGLDCGWTIPTEYNESVTFDVLGTIVGVTHGNQFRAMKAIDWWAKQQHGGQPVGAADVLVTAHYHSLAIVPTGRNPYNGRSKFWIQAPTLDNGSDWFRNIAGQDSDPGLLVFDIDADGFNLQSLTVL